MNLEDILLDPLFSLPVKNNTGKPFIQFLTDLLHQYLQKLRTNPGFLSPFAQIIELEQDYIRNVEYVNGLLIQTLNQKRLGDVELSIKTFEKLMKNISIFLYSQEHKTYKIRPSDIFYRGKYFAPTDTVKIHRVEEPRLFFHAPFEIPDLVGSTRFSPIGCPALYLANSISVGYVECRAKEMDNFQGVKFVSNTIMKVLDLNFTLPDSTERYRNIDEYELKLQSKGLLFPLYAACFTIYEGSAINPQEYTIPQYISKWVKDSMYYEGIKYPSTKTWNGLYQGKFDNFIIHTKSEKESGYDDSLKAAFNMSPVCSCYHQMDKIEEFFLAEYPSVGIINSDIVNIEMPIGESVPYDKTTIGKMEFFMKNSLAANSIDI